MIALEDLEKITTLVIHENSPGNPCPDGVASCLILSDAFPGRKFIFAAYQSKTLLELKCEPGILFCDLTPPRERVEEFVEAGTFVLDHHVQQKDIVERFGFRGVYADAPGVSGAMLAYKEVFYPLFEDKHGPFGRDGEPECHRAMKFAELAGIRDTWQKNDSHWIQSCEQAEALRFWPWEMLQAIESPFSLEGWKKLEGMMAIGKVLFQKRQEKVQHLLKELYRSQTDKGTRYAVMNTTETSDVAEAVQDVDVLVGFRYLTREENTILVFSLRSRGSYDVGALASFYGGGGHKGAAGFQIGNGSPGEWINPFSEIRQLLNRFESKK